MMVILAFSGPAMAKFTAEEAARLDAEAKATAEKFLTDTKRGKEVFDNSPEALNKDHSGLTVETRPSHPPAG